MPRLPGAPKRWPRRIRFPSAQWSDCDAYTYTNSQPCDPNAHAHPYTRADARCSEGIKGTNETASSFTANWTSVSGATGYRLDVSLSSSFTSYVPGYQNLDVGNRTGYNVTGLSANTFYYYRLRAYNRGATSANSNVIKVKTKPY
jgi:hypothetical protein